MIFLSFTDKITDIISPYRFLKYLLYNNNFTYLFFALLLFFSFLYQPYLNYEKYPFFRVRLQCIVLDVYVFFWFSIKSIHFRLDFRRLSGPVFDPARMSEGSFSPTAVGNRAYIYLSWTPTFEGRRVQLCHDYQEFSSVGWVGILISFWRNEE